MRKITTEVGASSIGGDRILAYAFFQRTYNSHSDRSTSMDMSLLSLLLLCCFRGKTISEAEIIIH